MPNERRGCQAGEHMWGLSPGAVCPKKATGGFEVLDFVRWMAACRAPRTRRSHPPSRRPGGRLVRLSFGGPQTAESRSALREAGIPLGGAIEEEAVTARTGPLAMPRLEVRDCGADELADRLERVLNG